MKKYITACFIILLITGLSYAQAENWNILKISRQLSSIHFLSSSNALMFGGDVNFKSPDQGANWYPIFSPVVLNQLTFTDSLYGWSTRSNNSIYKTINGSNSWSVINISNFNSIRGIDFVNRTTGWLIGVSGVLNQVAKSTNGGANWSVINNTLRFRPDQIEMLTPTKVIISSTLKDTIAMTTDGGSNWTYQKIGTGQPVIKMFFLDSLRGWAVGLVDYVARTTNGGLNWTVHPTSIGNVSDMSFTDPLNGWITEVTSGRSIWKSTDGGITWIETLNLNPEHALCIFFKNNSTGWVTLNTGSILNTTNNGVDWIRQDESIGTSFVRSIDFINNNEGWMYAGSIWKTNNKGYTWFKQAAIPYLKSIDFVDQQTGFASGDYGLLYKSTNGGSNWNQLEIDSFHFERITMVNANTGYVCGSSGKVYKTTNGGLNWVNKPTGVVAALLDINYIDAQNVFVCGSGGIFLKTSNGGDNWITNMPLDTRAFSGVHFVNVNTGFVIGTLQSGNPLPNTNIKIIKTTNGGTTWFDVYSSSAAGFGSITDIHFINSQLGWCTVSHDTKGSILRTIDGGNSWSISFGPFGLSSALPGGLYCITATSENSVWASGFSGTILSTNPPIGIQSTSSEIPSVFVLSQNYPNPFNPQTKIKFDVPKASFTKLVIYDLLGREVATLVNEELRPGTYEADWDASSFSSGVYFYRIISGDFVETKKMVLMK